MGYQYEFNWILKLSEIGEIHVGDCYNFTKKGNRIYPLNTPIDLVNNKWEALARCIIHKIELTKNKTEGSYEIIEVYSNEKKQILTEQWRSLLQTTKGLNIVENFEQIHIT